MKLGHTCKPVEAISPGGRLGMREGAGVKGEPLAGTDARARPDLRVAGGAASGRDLRLCTAGGAGVHMKSEGTYVYVWRPRPGGT